jgi:GNAT superfamily N-acetyltransferase
MIRRATADDVPAIVAMAERFVASTPYQAHLAVSAPHVAALAEQLFASPDGVVFLAEKNGTPVGMLGVLIYPHPVSGQRIASEMVWWVEPEHRGGTAGVRLLKQAEAWAAAHQAIAMQMIAPTAKVGQFYEAIGYVPMETSYMRTL